MIINPDQFDAAFQKLPLPIREYLANKYGLHVDTIGGLERETSNMLLGIINPSQFVGELKSVGIPEASIGAIVEELNAKVFIPLREKMKNPTPDTEGEAAEEEGSDVVRPSIQVTPPPVPTPTIITPNPAPIVPPQPVIIAPVPTPMPAAPAISYAPPQPPPAPAPVSAPKPVVPPPPAYTAPVPTPSVSAFQQPQTSQFPSGTSSFSPLSSILTPVSVPENVPPQHVRTMKEDMLMSQANPRVEATPLTAPVRPPAYSQVPTSSTFVPPAAPVPQSTTSIQNPQQGIKPPQPQKTDNRDALHSVLKEYGIDPYRELPD